MPPTVVVAAAAAVTAAADAAAKGGDEGESFATSAFATAFDLGLLVLEGRLAGRS